MQVLPSIAAEITPISQIISEKVSLGNVTIAGWVRTKREAKRFSFLEINDGSGPKSIQVIADSTLPNYTEIVQNLTTGASVKIIGELVASKGQGQKFEVIAKEVHCYGFANPETYPLQKKDMSFEYLREVAYLRSRTATFSSVFRLRARVSKAIHDFFSNQGFYYIHSPIISTADCEGAGEQFQVTTLPLTKLPKTPQGEIDFSEDFFGSHAYLSVSGQLQGEIMALGLGKIYTFAPTFRAENSNTSRHLSEFWMIEPEMAFHNLEDNMRLAEGFVKHLVKDVLDNCMDDLKIIAQKTEVNTIENLQMCLTNSFGRVSYTEAVEILQNCGKKFEYPVEWGTDLQSEHERYLCEQHFKSPIIVYNYPKDFKAFYMYLNDDGKTVRAMDVLVPGVGEIIGGSQREDREELLRKRMGDMGIDATKMDWYLSLRRWGGVPHSGFGLGLERVLMWITGMGNVRDVIPFPRTPKNCEF